jgi:hypothetical protein
MAKNASLPADLLKEVADFTLKVCTPLYWHDRKALFPKRLIGGSCFVLRFGDRLVGVTAAHVLDAYQDARERVPNFVCQLRLMEFSLHDATIDSDAELDIATFGLSEDELKRIEGVPIDCTGQWPPPNPDRMKAVSLAGFPQALLITSADKSASFQAYGALSAIEDFSEREILLTYDPKRDQPFGGHAIPPLGLNLSGCSGGPTLMHGTRNGLHRWFPVGLINSGSKRDTAEPIERGDAQDFDTIRVRRIHRLREDGTIQLTQQSGWLPGSR